MAAPLILAIDQGTTSTRAILFDLDGWPVSVAQEEFRQIYPRPGWVEHDPEDIWATTIKVCREALAGEGAAEHEAVAVGITNQRETTVVWDRRSGKALHNAIVWQDRRTADRCEALKDAGHEAAVSDKTGLLLDPYFSATKIAWILDQVDGAREAAQRGELAFGTTDSYLLWRLTGGRVHATDATNASRTALFNIHTQQWDEELLELFRVPRALLPEVRDSAGDFGRCQKAHFGQALPIGGIAGDQQAAAIGQACFAPGMVKSTYGTGCFALMNTGERAVRSRNRLLTTVAYRIRGRTAYAVEGSIFVAGAAVKWLRDGLGIIATAAQTQDLASGLEENRGVYLVPAFVGLGAPHWDARARGAVFGLTLDAGPPELARAALESVCYQTRDLIRAMHDDGATAPTALRVDGGMVVNSWLVQFLADIIDLPVERPAFTETTALGAAYLAGLHAGLLTSFDDITNRWQCERRFDPTMGSEERARLVSGWERAVRRTLER